MGKRKVCPCGAKSVPGLISSVALCQAHFNGIFYPKTGAEHQEAVTMLKCSQKERAE